MQVGRKAEEGVVVVGVVEVCVELIMVWVLDIIQNLVMLHLRQIGRASCRERVCT